MASLNIGVDRQMAKLLLVMGATIGFHILVNSLIAGLRDATDNVRGRNPQARFVAVMPVIAHFSLLLVNFGALFGIGLGALLVWGTQRHEAGYPGRLLWFGFALNIVALAVALLSHVLILIYS